MNLRKLILACIAAFSFAGSAHAITDCSLSKVNNIWTGDSGDILVTMNNGASFSISHTDPNVQNILKMASLSLVMKTTLTIRYFASGVVCTNTTTRTDVNGTFLYGV